VTLNATPDDRELALAELEEVEAERLDLGQDAVEGRPVQEAREHGFGALQPRRHRRERR